MKRSRRRVISIETEQLIKTQPILKTLVFSVALSIASLGESVRHYLRTRPPLVIELHLDDICIAAYEDSRLPLGSTRTFALTDPRVTTED